MAAPRILGVCGWSGSGKTTLLAAVLPLLVARALRVAAVKHAHHGFDLDRPGKDSWRLREAGAAEVLVASGRRWALLHELDGAEPSLDDLLDRLSPADLVLVEGWKAHPHPKIEVHRPHLGKPPLWPDMPGIVAVASDAALPACPHPILPLNNAAVVADWILSYDATVIPA